MATCAHLLHPRLRILYLEPFNGGSHAVFTRTLTQGLVADWTVLTLPGRHWKWRMRGSASWFALSQAAELGRPYDLLWASSYLPLHSLRGLVPGLHRLPSVLYFHENQLAYPVRDEHTGARDFHFGFSQLEAALAATVCAFNSRYNRDTFLDEAGRLLRRLPDAVPPGFVERLAAKSQVLPFPLELDDSPLLSDPDPGPARAAGPLLLWNQRWEHDKDPDQFFRVLRSLAEAGVPFRVAVCGEQYSRQPAVFAEARSWLGDRVAHWGYVAAATGYRSLLGQAQLVISTARHEFFGVAILEAVQAGAYPLVPNRLAYPEHFPEEYRYDTEEQLRSRLTRLCRAWSSGELDLRRDRRDLTVPWSVERILPRYQALFEELVAAGPGAAGGALPAAAPGLARG